MFSLESFTRAAIVRKYVKKTPLQSLPTLSKIIGKPVYLKNEAEQRGLSPMVNLPLGGSFKSRGVFWDVYRTIDSLVEDKIDGHPIIHKGLKLVTQSTGNHGIALIHAVTASIKHISDRIRINQPALAESLLKIEPGVFTLRELPNCKMEPMQKAIETYREVSGQTQGGFIDHNYSCYEDSLDARLTYLKTQGEQAIYMEHGGKNIIIGHGSAGLEIDEQMTKLGYGQESKIGILVPVGAGGPLGILAAMKVQRSNSVTIMVQPHHHEAFVRTLQTGVSQKNGKSPPATDEAREQGKRQDIIFSDGVAVDQPELFAVDVARAYLDGAVVVDETASYNGSGTLLLHDVIAHYENPAHAKVGGTSAITAEALLQLRCNNHKLIDGCDAFVLFGTEGNVHPHVDQHLRSRLNLVGHNS